MDAKKMMEKVKSFCDFVANCAYSFISSRYKMFNQITDKSDGGS